MYVLSRLVTELLLCPGLGASLHSGNVKMETAVCVCVCVWGGGGGGGGGGGE